ncbi:MAG: hypothetical protein IPL74_00860 [Bacteroidetes bacterium]|nr:hypothetical protein [Bacteroidota bacterium]
MPVQLLQVRNYTLNHTFAGAAPTGVTVPINWAITPGNYTLYQSVSGAACWRDFSGGTSVPATVYPYYIGTACTLTDATLAGYTYFFYNWTITQVVKEVVQLLLQLLTLHQLLLLLVVQVRCVMVTQLL